MRPKYPVEAIDEISNYIERKQTAIVLDVGCGTGISTRQIADRSQSVVIGCDSDQEMLSYAMKDRAKKVAYVVGTLPKLPFTSKRFDLVTACTSFHWFCDQQSIKEIERVLKKDGIFCILQPKHTSAFAGDLRMIIEQVLGYAVPVRYSEIDFEAALLEGGFQVDHRKIVQDNHEYSLSDYLALIQSYSVWNDVPEEMREHVLNAFQVQLASRLEGGLLRDTRDVEVIVARPHES